MNSTIFSMFQQLQNQWIALLVGCFFLFSITNIHAQRASWVDRPNVQVGAEFSVLFDSQLLQNFESSTLSNSGDYRFETLTGTSYRFGGFVRLRFYQNQHIETGIYRTARRYNSTVSLVSSSNDLATTSVQSIAYELPAIWSISIRVSEKGYMYAGFGGVGTFFASNFGSFGGDLQLNGIADPRFIPGMQAHVGYEWDWGSSGGLYFGGNFQHNFDNVGRMGLLYREGVDTIANGVLDLNGSYFAAVIRYMLPGS